jgi:hypothetical protein
MLVAIATVFTVIYFWVMLHQITHAKCSELCRWGLFAMFVGWVAFWIWFLMRSSGFWEAAAAILFLVSPAFAGDEQ